MSNNYDITLHENDRKTYEGMMQHSRESFFIGNQWVKPASDRRFTLVNPSTEETIGTVPEGTEADIDAAVKAARTAFETSGWADAAPAERAETMFRFADAIAKRSQDLSHAVSLQNGMPVSVSQILEGHAPVDIVRYYGELAKTVGQLDVRQTYNGMIAQVDRTPIGVAAAIVPWNFPVTLSLSKIAPAMAAGCTMVLKPSPGTVLDSYIMAEAAIEANLPPGVLNWVAADRDVGAYLVSHPGIDKVAFTGSTGAGRAIARTCGEMLRPVTLELGGKSAAILLDDADVAAFIGSVPFTSMLNNGQTCFNGTRILAPKHRYDEIVEALVSVTQSMTIGHALGPMTQLGPLASSAQRAKVEEYLAIGKNEGRVATGGGRPAHMNRGWYVEPTVITHVESSARIAQEEIFGPVVVVIAYDGEEEAIRIANDSQFGLGGSVWSKDADHAAQVARSVQSGTVGVNGYQPLLGAPFGGIKASGIGREFGPDAVQAYQHTKSIYLLG